MADAAANIGERLDSIDIRAKDLAPQGQDRRQRFEADVLKGDAIASLVWLPTNRHAMRLCWRVVLRGKTRGEMFQVLVDAQTGE